MRSLLELRICDWYDHLVLRNYANYNFLGSNINKVICLPK
jgi:hypothetical protein